MIYLTNSAFFYRLKNFVHSCWSCNYCERSYSICLIMIWIIYF